METAISQGLEVFDKVEDFTSRLFESRRMTSAFKVTPVSYGLKTAQKINDTSQKST